MSLINFESHKAIKKRKKEDQQLRQNILAKAKHKYEIKKEKQIAAEERGETVWILPAIDKKINAQNGKRKAKDNDGKQEEGSSHTEPTVVDPGQPSKRQDWMELSSLFKTREQIRIEDRSSRSLKRLQERSRKEEANKPGSHALELNPYYKSGGVGLPPEATENQASEKRKIVSKCDAQWLRKALRRAKEKAKEEGRTLEDVARDRWGSLEKFYSLLDEAEGQGRSEGATRKRSEESNDGGGRNRDTNWKSIDPDRKYRSSCKEEMRRNKDNRRERSRSRDRHRRGDREKSSNRKNPSTDRESSGSRDDCRRKMNSKRHQRRDRSSSSSSSTSSSSSSSSSCKEKSNRKGSRKEDRSRKTGQKCMSNDDSSQKGKMKSSSTLQKSAMLKPGSESDSPPRSRTSPSHQLERGQCDYLHHSKLKNKWRKDIPQPSRVTELKRPADCPGNQATGSYNTVIVAAESFELPESRASQQRATEAQPKDEKTKSSIEPTVALTSAQMNQLAAKLTKAELMGNDALVKKLKKKLEKARAAREAKDNVLSDTGDEDVHEEVILTRTNSLGFTRPIDGRQEKVSKKLPKKEMVGADGYRTAYFPDDSELNLKDMFVKEKLISATDQIAAMERLAATNSEKLSDDFDLDDMYVSKVSRETGQRENERDRQKAILEHRRSEKILDSCSYCVGNKLMKKHLIVALGTKCYLSVPYHQSLTEGHCLIVPLHHVPCGTLADEDLWDEVMRFRKALVQMYSSNDEDCVFFECALRLHQPPHMVIHCIPLPRETGELAPIYFKKAILECDEEWAQNKKLIELKGRSVRRAVPKGLPYFCVDFGMTPGFAHVVENENLFPRNFGQEIIGGMIDADFSLFRKPKPENFDVQRRKVIEFSEKFKTFDPTS